MWCCACQKSMCHNSRSTADLHLTQPCQKKKEKAMKKVKQPKSGIQGEEGKFRQGRISRGKFRR